eukprot:764942-Hanusia_phi.AAC.1
MPLPSRYKLESEVIPLNSPRGMTVMPLPCKLSVQHPQPARARQLRQTREAVVVQAEGAEAAV